MSGETTYHVIPQCDGHLGVSSLTDVKTVHREESGVRLPFLDQQRPRLQFGLIFFFFS